MAVRMPVSAAILCGGEGRRMGGADKSQLVVAGQSFIERQLDVLRPLTPQIMLIDRDASHTRPRGVRVVRDLVQNAGALGGIYTALETAVTDRVIVVACDMPFVTTAFLESLLERDERADVVLPRDKEGRHPLCGVFHRRIRSALKTRIDARQLRFEDALATLTVTEVDTDSLVPFDTDGRLLLNVNTPAEYRQATRGDHQENASA